MTMLFSCSNPYQIMIAALLKLQLSGEEDVAEIIITDTFNGYDEVAARIRNTDYFNSVYLINVKDIIVAKTLTAKANKVSFLLAYKKRLSRIIGHPEKYDALFFNNEDIYIFNLISFLRLSNPNCRICRYEEGYSSYTNLESSSPNSKKIVDYRNRFQEKRISTEWDEFYVFEPDMLMKPYASVIRRIDRKFSAEASYKDFVLSVFDVNRVIDDYKKKYVIFEESFVNDGFEVDDISLFKKVIEIVGRKNLIVKLHPRSSKNRFADLGVEVKKPDGVPWEAIVLCSELKDIYLFALGSGSVINSRLLLGTNIKAFLLFKCLEKRPPAFDERFDLFFEKFKDKYGHDVVIPETTQEALAEIRKIIS